MRQRLVKQSEAKLRFPVCNDGMIVYWKIREFGLSEEEPLNSVTTRQSIRFQHYHVLSKYTTLRVGI